MVELNIKRFVDNIKELAGETKERYESGIKYLYDTLYDALMNNEDIHIGDIDFSRFSREEYRAFYDEVTSNTEDIKKLYSVFDSCAACNISANKTFF